MCQSLSGGNGVQKRDGTHLSIGVPIGAVPVGSSRVWLTLTLDGDSNCLCPPTCVAIIGLKVPTVLQPIVFDFMGLTLESYIASPLAINIYLLIGLLLLLY